MRMYTSLMLMFLVVTILFSGEVFALKQSVSIYFCDERMDFSEIEPISYKSTIMTPMRKSFEGIGAQVKWDETTDIITGKINGNTVVLQANNNSMFVNSIEKHIDVPPMYINNNLMVPLRTVAEALFCDVNWNSKTMSLQIGKPKKFNPMLGTELNDDYRYSIHCGNFNGFDVFKKNDDEKNDDYFCMELINLHDDQCTRYSKLINDFAVAASDATIYSIVIPTSSEFYADAEHVTNHLESISKIYSGLDEKIIPVNVQKTLMEHADEDIFFKTDHHWTQLGAYYAYKEFLDYSLDDIDPAENFKYDSISFFQGSFLDYTYDTDGYELLENTYDELEFYYPAVPSEGKSYFDVNLSEYISDMDAININFKNYDSFMEGDYPVEVYKNEINNGKKLCIIKESFGNAFAVWALNNYEEVYVVDFRRFNNYAADSESHREFKISDFYNNTKFDDLIIMSYPITICGDHEMTALEAMAN